MTCTWTKGECQGSFGGFSESAEHFPAIDVEEVIHGEFWSVRLTDGVWATILEHGSGKFKLNVMNSKWILGRARHLLYRYKSV